MTSKGKTQRIPPPAAPAANSQEGQGPQSEGGGKGSGGYWRLPTVSTCRTRAGEGSFKEDIFGPYPDLMDGGPTAYNQV